MKYKLIYYYDSDIREEIIEASTKLESIQKFIRKHYEESSRIGITKIEDEYDLKKQ